MTLVQNPKNLFILLFIVLMMAFVCIIAGHCRAYADQPKGRRSLRNNPNCLSPGFVINCLF